MATETLHSLIHRLSGVYRDPQRVIRDAENLLNSEVGHHLRPTTEPLMLNDGTSTPPVLMLGGTLPMTFRGVTYNLPIDMYLPPPYPLRPPTVFVRPVATMAIKENHRHVGLDGRVYLPYLSEWRPGTHELRELAVWMSSLFGSDPPCYAKRRNTNTGGGGHGNSVGNPPPYSQATTSAHTHVSSASSTQSALRASREEEEEKRRALEREIAEANLAAETARRAAEEESRLEAEQERLRKEHTQTMSNMRVMASSKAEFKIHQLFSQYKDEMKVELKDQQLLEKGKSDIERLLKEGEDKKTVLEKNNIEMDGMIKQLQDWLAQVEACKNAENAELDNLDGQVKVDLIALPTDTHSAQMLELSAEVATIEDCIYFLDRSLVRGNISLDVFLKEVRKLSKRQFLAKAHLLKIAQMKS